MLYVVLVGVHNPSKTLQSEPNTGSQILRIRRIRPTDLDHDLRNEVFRSGDQIGQAQIMGISDTFRCPKYHGYQDVQSINNMYIIYTYYVGSCNLTFTI